MSLNSGAKVIPQANKLVWKGLPDTGYPRKRLKKATSVPSKMTMLHGMNVITNQTVMPIQFQHSKHIR